MSYRATNKKPIPIYIMLGMFFVYRFFLVESKNIL